MTRYNRKAPLPSPPSSQSLSAKRPAHSPPLSEATPDIARVRSGLTASPQTRFSVFKLLPTAYGLEIKLPVNRVRGSLIATVIKDKTGGSTSLTLWAVTGMALFVGGVVVLTGSATFGVVIAILLPIVLWLITLSAKVTHGGYATLRLVNAPNGQTLLSMSMLPEQQRENASIAHSNEALRDKALRETYSPYVYSVDKPKAKTVVYFSNRSVKLVSTKTGIAGGELSFMVYTESAREGNCLRVTGNREEVRWLHARVAQWGKGRE